MNKICVYTAITGNYDNLKKIKYKDKNIDYICFTNNKDITSDFWKIIYVDEDLDNLTLARKIKIKGYEYLKEYNITIWMDGAIEVLKPISIFLKEKCDLEKYDMIGFKHKYRDCIYDEINECVRLNKETIDNALILEKFLIKEKYPKHNGLIESTVLVRKNNKKVNILMNDWFNMLIKYTRRDQLTFNYCLWKNSIEINFLNLYVFDNKYFKHDNHKGKEIYKNYRLYQGDSTFFDYHNCIDGKYLVEDFKKGINFTLTKDTERIEIAVDEIGNCIRNIKINKKAKISIYNSYEIKEYKFFYDKPIITFDGDFKKGDIVKIKMDIETFDKGKEIESIKEQIDKELKEASNIIDYLNAEVNSLKDEKNRLNEDINKILHSTSWKVTKPLRKISNKIKK